MACVEFAATSTFMPRAGSTVIAPVSRRNSLAIAIRTASTVQPVQAPEISRWKDIIVAIAWPAVRGANGKGGDDGGRRAKIVFAGTATVKEATFMTKLRSGTNDFCMTIIETAARSNGPDPSSAIMDTRTWFVSGSIFNAISSRERPVFGLTLSTTCRTAASRPSKEDSGGGKFSIISIPEAGGISMPAVNVGGAGGASEVMQPSPRHRLSHPHRTIVPSTSV